jgi:hypothetical protein
MDLHVGSAVKRKLRPAEHGVVTDVRKDSVTINWHLKVATNLGPAGMSTGGLIEYPADLAPDNPCPYCKPS